MRSLNPEPSSSILIVDHPAPQSVSFGADFASDMTQAMIAWQKRSYSVIALPADLVTDKDASSTALIATLDSSKSRALIVLVVRNAEPEQVRKLINQGSVFKVLHDFAAVEFESTMQEALEEQALLKQNQKLFQLVHEQNTRLLKLSADLEDRVQKREKKLEDSRANLIVANRRAEALHRALIAVHRAKSSGEMERLINEALESAMGLHWVRISLGPRPKVLTENTSFSLHRSRTRYGAHGEIVFARDKTSPFAKDEAQFLDQIAEAASLAIDRLGKLEQSETLKTQWEATFDAIDAPVAVINPQRQIVRMNRAFARTSQDANENLLGRNCYSVLFARTEACENCKMGQNFQLTMQANKPRTFEVTSQSIQDKLANQINFVHMYRDITEQLRIEAQIVENAKMAELGTIGSSIAHELNNPLGGMLSFLQLIQMDLKGQEAWKQDIDEMEQGARRCRDIVNNLLGFARKAESESNLHLDPMQAAADALQGHKSSK